MPPSRPPETTGIKLSELRPCDNCHGAIVPLFRVVDIKIAVLNKRQMHAVQGKLQAHGWHGMGGLMLAELIVPGADRVIEVLEDSETVVRLFICMKCWLNPLDLVVLAEQASEQAKAIDAKREKKDTSQT